MTTVPSVFGTALGVLVGAVVGVLNAVVLLFLPAAVAYWLWGQDAGLTWWETFAWVEFIGAMVGAAFVLLVAVPMQWAEDGIAGAVAVAAYALLGAAVGLGIALGFGII